MYGRAASVFLVGASKIDLCTFGSEMEKILAHHLKLVDGGLVEIHAPNNSKINARLGRIANVTDCTVQVWVRDIDSMTMLLHTFRASTSRTCINGARAAVGIGAIAYRSAQKM